MTDLLDVSGGTTAQEGIFSKGSAHQTAPMDSHESPPRQGAPQDAGRRQRHHLPAIAGEAIAKIGPADDTSLGVLTPDGLVAAGDPRAAIPGLDAALKDQERVMDDAGQEGPP